MALVKYGGGVVQASGSIAGTVHARNRFGNYIRARTKPVNPNSSLQSVVRVALAYWAAYWHSPLSGANRIAWATYAAAVSMKNRLGETVYLTGFNHFLRVQIVRTQLEQTACPNGPTSLSLPEKDTGFSITASTGTQLVSVTWTKALPWTEIPASVMGLWMGVPQIATRNFFNGPWKKMGTIAGNCPDSPVTKAPPMTLTLGQKIWVYARISTGPLDSRLSEPFIASCIVGA